MKLYEEPMERTTAMGNSSLTYSENANSCDLYTSPPLILRSYTSINSSNMSSNKPQQRYPDKENENCSSDTLNRTTSHMKSSIDYIYRLVEQSERRYVQQEHSKLIAQEWQILGRVVDRLLVLVFLVSTILVFLCIFLQAPHLRLK